MTDDVVLRAMTGPPGSRLAELLDEGLAPLAPLRATTGGRDRVVVRVGGPHEMLRTIGADLPDGPARAEAVTARLRRRGLEPRWGSPVHVDGIPQLLAYCRARGRSSVELVRADPSLITELQVGAWFDAPWRTRWVRRALHHRAAVLPALRSPRMLAAAADLAFWAGVRERATAAEWRWLTASSYVALVYHRFAGELKAGQERIDITPGRFARHLRALRLAGFRSVTAEAALAFHARTTLALSPRSVVITVDDAMADCVAPLRRHATCAAALFVPTQELGGPAHWLGGEPVATWDDVRLLARAGVSIGSHGRRHSRLTELDAATQQAELAGSLADLRLMVDAPMPAIAYPYGDHDAAVCAAAQAAGMKAGFTTLKGRNGAGTDPYRLRRVSVHGADGPSAVVWKALTGEGLPRVWLRARALRHRQS